MSVWKDVRKTFNIGGLSYCVVWGLFGVAIVWVIGPKEPIYAIYLGMTAYPTISKLFGSFYPPNKHA